MAKTWPNVLTFCVSLCVVFTSGFHLNKDGGYDLVFSIAEETPSPPNAIIYLNRIQLISQMWSNAMWSITDNKFFINSLQFIVPHHWRLPSMPVTTQSRKTSDFRISHKFKYLRAENPNSCGLPGEFIELPAEFFNIAAWNGPFGTPWKALITQWARYRWGIWEEHGYPGDELYPYFYQKPGEPGWFTTGCSDIELKGEYLTTDNKTCNVSDSAYPGDDCRFIPFSSGNGDTMTSLMFFHWIVSVERFCDETTHNKESPNRQNRHCGHRSAWEVIRQTPDYHYVTEPPPSQVPDLQAALYTFKTSLYPRLSILLDKGKTSVSIEMLEKIIGGQIGQLFETGTIYNQTVAHIASFPPDQDEQEESTAMIKTEVQWSTIEDNLSFITALNNINVNGPDMRDFGSAIQAAVDDLVQKNNPAGSILIVVKTGSTAETFGNIPFEQDLMIILHDNPRIRLYAVEILENEQSSAHLERLTKVSKGKHVLIRTSEDIETKLRPVIEEITEICNTLKDPEPEKNNFRGIYKGKLVSNNVNEIPILTKNLQEVEFHVTTSAPIDQVYVQPLSVSRYRNTKFVTRVSEWNEGHDSTRRFTYSLKTTTQIHANSKWLIHYKCESSVSNCESTVHVYGKTNETSHDEIEPEMILSASSKVSDLSNSKGFSSSPLTIFASVHKLGQPVIDLDVTAIISRVNSNMTWSLTLRDDGYASPDIAIKDGIYSADFVPEVDGSYKISAFIKNRGCSVDDELQDESGIKLVLPDQKNFGCFPSSRNMEEANSACTGLTLVGPYGTIVFAPGVFHVVNSDRFTAGQPYKIVDLQGSIDVNLELTFTFTAPALMASQDRATSYTVYHSEHIEDLIGNVDSVQILGNYSVSSSPGNLELIRVKAPNNYLTYYAIATNYDILRSGPSNIVALKLNSDEPTIEISTTNNQDTTFITFTSEPSSSTVRVTTEHSTISTTEPTTTVASGLNTTATVVTMTTTDRVLTSTEPDYDDLPNRNSLVWTQPQIIAGISLAIICAIGFTYATIQFVRSRLAKKSIVVSTSVV